MRRWLMRPQAERCAGGNILAMRCRFATSLSGECWARGRALAPCQRCRRAGTCSIRIVLTPGWKSAGIRGAAPIFGTARFSRWGRRSRIRMLPRCGTNISRSRRYNSISRITRCSTSGRVRNFDWSRVDSSLEGGSPLPPRIFRTVTSRRSRRRGSDALQCGSFISPIVPAEHRIRYLPRVGLRSA